MEGAIEGWSDFWDAWAAVRASGELDPGHLEPVAAPDVVAGVIVLFKRQKLSGTVPVEIEVALHPKVTDSGVDRATLEYRVLLVPSLTDAASVW